jgi:Arc/MetJ family transcription regulator
MRTTVTLDDELLESASKAIGITKRSVVLREALKALIEREAARQLARLGGSDPGADAPPRRRASPGVPKRRASP